MVICQGCAGAFDLPAGYGRNKIQCPNCGVICPVPAGAERQPVGAPVRDARRKPMAEPEPSVEDEAAALLREPDPVPAPLFDDEPSPTPPSRPAAKPDQKAEVLLPCRRCGKKIRKQRECPDCDGAIEELPPPGNAPLNMELDDVPAPVNDEDEDTSPYLFSDKELPTCPRCRKERPVGSVLCASCGFDLRTRKKAVRTYDPIQRTWEADMSLGRRLAWLGAAQGLHLFLMLINIGFLDGTAKPFLVAWPLLVGILCFVLGTYERLTLLRDRRGRCKVVKVWRFFFVPVHPITTEVRGFEGLTTGQWHDAGVLEWFVFVSLLPLGVIPSIVWWYNAIHKPHFHVALAIDHGHSEVYLYRGRNQEQMNDIADTVSSASNLPRLA